MNKIISQDLTKSLEQIIERAVAPIVNSINLPKESFLFSYDGPHEDFFQELIIKVNENYGGTDAEIPFGIKGEIQGQLNQRMSIISTIVNDSNLRSSGLFPINATQSEYLLQKGKLTDQKEGQEDFGMVLYEGGWKTIYCGNFETTNARKIRAIYKSLKEHRGAFGLSESDLESRLVVVNPGAEIDSGMPSRIKPVVIPGVTQVYQHEVLEKVGDDKFFWSYGFDGGLPTLNQLGSGNRILHMPKETSDIGLYVFSRVCDFGLSIGKENFINCSLGTQINFARSKLP